MSIPGKWDPILPPPVTPGGTRNNQKKTINKGFGKSSTRFDNNHINDRPGKFVHYQIVWDINILWSLGPGYYTTDNISGQQSQCTLIRKTPSLSKKGYGNAFVSRTGKLIEESKEKLLVPGPGEYDALDLTNKTGFCRFGKGSKGRVPYVLGPKTPGPSDYNINFDPGKPKLVMKLPSSTFSSVSKRESFIQCFRLINISELL